MNHSQAPHGCPGTCSASPVSEPVPDLRAALLPRRNFVKTIMLMSAGSWLSGKPLESLFVADIHAQSSSQIGVFRIGLDTFPALRNELGSVRLKVAGMPTSFFNIIVTRQNGIYHAVTSRCTHEGNIVNAYSAAAGGLLCPTHSSLFNPDGSVKRTPATSPLPSYKTSFDGQNTIAVEIPGLGFDITTAAVLNPATGARRIRIDFPSVSTVRYAVRFRPSLVSGEWTQIPFATAIDGPATTNELTGNNARRSVFVERAEQLGFYAVTRTS